ncbi:photosynthetic complex putative assembly protein PuhB [Aestuariivirga sp.]|uniref:photosynthetic complex putative assembly protein PuhB n=1 Tax=Aestuariivirga sp. TaxID=2650926 RepID=UPI0025BD38E2|nr:photosynthetic complex putative assembly protein PuhB [Aestuariivirga sp.]MCA3555776.1 PH domain-containing protein [Aestuariivirga sp.]
MTGHHDDFDFEPVRGLPQMLPQGERLLWQGAPRWQDLAVHAFHVRKVIWYFAGLTLLAGALRFAEGGSLAYAARPFQWLMPMGLVAAALLSGLAWLSARTTVYTITTKRVVMRIGMALPVTLNVPFSQIDGASLRVFGNGSGDIPLKVTKKERIAYLLLWPHARPFNFAHPQPCLRCVPRADDVASLLAAALTGTAIAPIALEVPDHRPVKTGQPVAA